MPACLLAGRLIVLNHSCQEARKHACKYQHVLYVHTRLHPRLPILIHKHYGHVHACLPHATHTSPCISRWTKSPSHWIIFSAAFIALSLTILLLSLHASFHLPLPVFPFIYHVVCFFNSLSLGTLLSVYSITQFPSSLCDPTTTTHTTYTCTHAPPSPSWVPSYLTTLRWSSKRHCSRACEVIASSSFLFPFLSPSLYSPLHFTLLSFSLLLPRSLALQPSLLHLTLHFSPPLLPSICTSSGLVSFRLSSASKTPLLFSSTLLSTS